MPPKRKSRPPKRPVSWKGRLTSGSCGRATGATTANLAIDCAAQSLSAGSRHIGDRPEGEGAMGPPRGEEWPITSYLRARPQSRSLVQARYRTVEGHEYYEIPVLGLHPAGNLNIGMHLRPLRTHQPDNPDQADGQRLRRKAYQCAAAGVSTRSGLRYLWVSAVFAILIVQATAPAGVQAGTSTAPILEPRSCPRPFAPRLPF
jgi:hypothetical protein